MRTSCASLRNAASIAGSSSASETAMWSLTLLASSVSTDVSMGPVTLPGGPPHSALRPRPGPHRPGTISVLSRPRARGVRTDMEIRASLLEFVLFIVPWIAAVGWLCSRVLGISLGRWRASVVAIVGWLGGVVCTAVIVDKHETLWVVVPMTLFFGVIVAMPAAIVLDLITRSTRARTTHRVRRTVLHPIRTTKNTFAPIGRMRELVRDARHHNLVHVRYRSEYAVDTADFALRLRLTIEDAGGMMVKFGQIASTRTDLLPETLTSELAKLQSNVRPIDADAVREVIETAFDEPVEQTFAEFDFEPLAAASIGQTHRARLTTGERVVVKVQRPGVAELVDRDA